MTESTNLTMTAAEGTPKSLTSIAFDQIRNDILLCHLRPEERLRINTLASRYEVGPTAVREALSRLVTDGLVMSEDQCGFYVAPVSRAELLDLTQTRIDIEALALGKSIAKGDVDWESRIVSCFHRLSKTPLPLDQGGQLHERWALVHRDFHESLISGCQSVWLMRLSALLYDKSERYRNLAEFRTSPGARNASQEHLDLMEVVIARNTEQAVKMLSDHFWGTANIILESDLFNPKSVRQTKDRKST